MIAIALTERSGAADRELVDTAGCTAHEPGRSLGSHTDGRSKVIDSTAEQTWAEFCGMLDEPAFLLAITGFADL